MENIKLPLISCLCITSERSDFLQRSISCFLGQTYPNKELVIVYDRNNVITNQIANFNKYSNVFFYELNESKSNTLNTMRSYALEKAKGDYICLWAEDDWHHIARIEYQYEAIAIAGVDACVLNYILIFDDITNKSYVSKKKLWETTLLSKTSDFKEQVKGNYFSETDITTFLEGSYKEKKVYIINDVPNLYIYSHYSSKDVWANESWQDISDYSYALGKGDSQQIKKIIEGYESIEENALALDHLIGNPLFEEDECNESEIIPKIIHVTYKSKIIPDKYKVTFDSIKTMHPTWEIRIYDDQDAPKIVEAHFPEIIDIYMAYPCNVQRTDIFRLLIVYLEGGFYLDLDMYCLKSLDELCNLNLVLAEEITYSDAERKLLNFKNDRQVSNYMFGSIPKHPFWIEVLLEAIKNADCKIFTQIDVLKTTGPWLLSYVYYNLKDKYPDITFLINKFKRCHKGCPTVSCHFGDFAAHHHMGSWLWHIKENNIPFPNNELNNISDELKQEAFNVMSKRL